MMQSTASTGWRRRRARPIRRRRSAQEADLAYQAGVEVKARSQWQYMRMRFFRHKAAVAGLVILILFALVAIFAKQLAPYGYDEINLENIDPETGLAHSPRRSTIGTSSAPISSAATT